MQSFAAAQKKSHSDEWLFLIRARRI